MLDRIAREINRTDLTADASDAIISAINHFRSHPFTFNVKRAAFDMQDSETTTAPVDLLEPLSLRVKTTSTVWSMLERRTVVEIEELLNSPVITGYPRVYSYLDSKIYPYPEPDSTQSAKMVYVYNLHYSQSFTTAVSTAWFNGPAEELIRTHAEIELFEMVLRGNDAYTHAQVLRTRELLILNRLDQEFAQLYSTGKMRNRSGLRNRRPIY